MLSLHDIYNRYNTDKNSTFHNYSRQYEILFAPFREMHINILEIGVLDGCSLLTWRDAFQNAFNIIGLDITPGCKSYEETKRNIYVEIIDATNKNQVIEVVNRFGPPDIILDDGSHINRDVIKSFEILFPLMNDDGLYIVEDTICYKSDRHIDHNYPNHLQYFSSFVPFLNQWRFDSICGTRDNCVDPFKIQKQTDNIFEYSIDKIEFGCSFVAIHKKLRKHWIYKQQRS